ncbi:helix-turn-helix domain-containing protein [Ekhidna lutea]
MSRLENGHKQPTLTTLFKIADKLEVSVELLISKIKIMHQDHEK